MTSDEIALLRAIQAAPDNDLPRLVYADWLEEHGRAEHAEFVRVQCELATGRLACRYGNSSWGPENTHAIGTCAWCDLRKREQELFKDSGPRWWNDLPGSWRATVGRDTSIETAEGWKYLVRRGFVARVTYPITAWLGERCNFCDGRGTLLGAGPDRGNPTCDDCHGTGYVGGVAAAVCGSQPVEAVALTGREPVHRPTFLTPGWGWYPWDEGWDEDAEADPDNLPRVLYDRLKGDIQPARNIAWKVYPTRRAALDALSAAALAVGREWAGLTRP